MLHIYQIFISWHLIFPVIYGKIFSKCSYDYETSVPGILKFLKKTTTNNVFETWPNSVFTNLASMIMFKTVQNLPVYSHPKILTISSVLNTLS